MFENTSEVIVKVTRDCNFRCSYCYVKDKDNFKNEKMTQNTFESFIDRVVSDKGKNTRPIQNQKFSVVFHGGEPTLLGIKKLEKFILYAKKRIPYVKFSMQTNLSLINQDWASFFNKYKVSVGVSLDGATDILNKYRDNQINFEEKIRLLRDNKVDFGTLMIVSDKNINDFFVNLKDLRQLTGNKIIKANYVENINEARFTEPEISGKDYYQKVFVPIMEEFLNNTDIGEDNALFIVENFINTIIFDEDSILQDIPRTNCMSKFCAGGNNIVEIDPEGNVCFCGRWAENHSINLMGSFIKDNDIFGLNSYFNALNIQIEKAKAIRKTNCDECFAQDICSYGCAAFSYEKFNGQIKIREELVCDFSKRAKTFLLENMGNIFYSYVKFKNWNIIEKEDVILLNIPILKSGLTLNENIGYDLKWVEESPQKWYLSLPKKIIREQVIIK